ncbi:hypothetical protein Tco_0499493 [Tanacetum coccineum]
MSSLDVILSPWLSSIHIPCFWCLRKVSRFICLLQTAMDSRWWLCIGLAILFAFVSCGLNEIWCWSEAFVVGHMHGVHNIPFWIVSECQIAYAFRWLPTFLELSDMHQQLSIFHLQFQSISNESLLFLIHNGGSILRSLFVTVRMCLFRICWRILCAGTLEVVTIRWECKGPLKLHFVKASPFGIWFQCIVRTYDRHCAYRPVASIGGRSLEPAAIMI